jgi:tetratricopeptide (TPR) repeat protein
LQQIILGIYMKVKIIALIILVYLVIGNNYSPAQSFSGPDSTLLSNAKNDTSLLRQIVTNRPGELIAAKAQNQIGLILFNAKNESNASQEFLAVYNQFLGTQDAYTATYYLGKIAFHVDNLKNAKKYFSEYLASHPNDGNVLWAQYYYIKAKYRDNDSDYVEAAHHFLSVQNDFKQSKKATMQYELISYLVKNNKYSEALNEANKMMKLYPADTLSGKVKYMIGEIYSSLDRSSDALAQYNLILQKPGITSIEAAKTRFHIGEVYASQNDFTNARTSYHLILTDFPNLKRWVAAANYSLAMLNYQEWLLQKDSTNLANGYSALQNYITHHPEDHHMPLALRALADLYLSEGKYTEAINSFDKILNYDTSLVTLNPRASVRSNDLKAHKKIVKDVNFAKIRILREKLHMPEAAMSILVKILSNSENNGEAKLNKALCLIDLKRSNEAKFLLEQLVQEGGKQKNYAQHILLTLK